MKGVGAGGGGVSLDIIYIVIVEEGFTVLRTDGFRRKIARQKSVKLHFLTEDKEHTFK